MEAVLTARTVVQQAWRLLDPSEGAGQLASPTRPPLMEPRSFNPVQTPIREYSNRPGHFLGGSNEALELYIRF